MADELMSWDEVEQIAGRLFKQSRAVERLLDAVRTVKTADAEVRRLETERAGLAEVLAGLGRDREAAAASVQQLTEQLEAVKEQVTAALTERERLMREIAATKAAATRESEEQRRRAQAERAEERRVAVEERQARERAAEGHRVRLAEMIGKLERRQAELEAGLKDFLARHSVA